MSIKTYEISADHEKEIQELAKYLPQGLPVIELGGGLGVVSCFINSLLGPTYHTVIEANPDLIPHIESRRDKNRCRFDVLNRALSYTASKIMFNIDRSFVSSSEKRSGSPTIIERVEVPTIKLRDLVKERSIIISDIEGNEIDLIDNDMKALKNNAEYLVIEFHKRISGKWQIRKSLLKLWLNGFRILKKYESETCPSYLFINKPLMKKS